MIEFFVFYFTLGIIALCLVLLSLPTIIARKIVERQKREGLYKTKKQA